MQSLSEVAGVSPRQNDRTRHCPPTRHPLTARHEMTTEDQLDNESSDICRSLETLPGVSCTAFFKDDDAEFVLSLTVPAEPGALEHRLDLLLNDLINALPSVSKATKLRHTELMDYVRRTAYEAACAMRAKIQNGELQPHSKG